MTTTYNSIIAGYSPSAWWKLEDASGTTAIDDSSGNDNTGTASNVTFGSAAGPLGTGATAGEFNGTSSKITTGFDFTGSANTVIVWYNLANNTGYPFPITTDSTGNKGFWLEMASGVPHFIVFPASGSAVSATWGSTPTAAAWHMAAMTWDGTTVRGSIDGGTQVTATGGTGAMVAGTQHVTIGYDATSGDYTTGSIAQVALIPSLLTQAEIVALYAAAPNAGTVTSGFFASC